MATNKTVAYDFRESDDDLAINSVTGDFDFVPSDNQHIKDILASFPGWFKEFPAVGAGVPFMLKGKFNVQKVEAIIKQQLEGDGYQVARPQVSISPNGRAVIKPNAVRINI